MTKTNAVQDFETISGDFDGTNVPPAQTHITITQVKNLLQEEDGAALVGLELAQQLHALCSIPGYKTQAIPVMRQWIGAAIIAASKSEGVAAYRLYVPMLRWIMSISKNTDTLMLAKEALGDLYLEQTASSENQWWIDPMTGAIDGEAAAEMAANKTATAWLKDDAEFVAALKKAEAAAADVSAAYAGRAVPVVPVSKNSLTVSIMAHYEDPEMARAAIRATQSPIGDMPEWEDPELGEDRDFTPPPLVKDFDPDMSVVSWDVVNAFRGWKSECWKRAWMAYPENKMANAATRKSNWAKRMAEFKTRFISNPAPRQNLLVAVANWSRTDPQAAAVAIYPFVVDDEMALEKGHHYGWDETSSGIVEIEDVTTMAGVDFVMDELPTEVSVALDMFETEIADRASSDAVSGGEEDIALVEAFVADFVSEIEKVYPETDVKPESTRSFNMAYIEAIAANSKPEEATATAWYAWRCAMSEKGSREFDAEMLLSGSQGKAWAAFWKFTPAYVPRPQSEMLSVKSTGMKIASYGKEREISWAVAKMKLSANELDLTKADKLLAVLEKHQWPAAAWFTTALSTLRAKNTFLRRAKAKYNVMKSLYAKAVNLGEPMKFA